MSNITVIKGDITAAEVDAIVNAANPMMLGGGGVDAAIHRAAGKKLLQACEDVAMIDGVRCPTGEARITEAGDLKANYVIHTVGPRYAIDSNPESLLYAAYENSLDLAMKHHCESIAFPAISCGVYGYPLDKAARIAIDVCMLDKYKNIKIIFYLFNDAAFDIWNDLIDMQKQSG